MTTKELREYLNNQFGLNPWPQTFEVDAETYGNVCQDVINWTVNENGVWKSFNSENEFHIKIAIGDQNGILFKGVELILKR